MLALLKRNFLLYFRNRSGVFFSLLGALISFILYIIFLQKNLTDAWAQLPNSGSVLNNWLMSGTLAVTGITTSLAALTQLVKDRERQVDQDLYLSDQGKWRFPSSFLARGIIIFFFLPVLLYVLVCGFFLRISKLSILPGVFLFFLVSVLLFFLLNSLFFFFF